MTKTTNLFLGYKITPYRDLKRPSGLKRSSSLRTPRGRRDSGSNESGMKSCIESSKLDADGLCIYTDRSKHCLNISS